MRRFAKVLSEDALDNGVWLVRCVVAQIGKRLEVLRRQNVVHGSDSLTKLDVQALVLLAHSYQSIGNACVQLIQFIGMARKPDLLPTDQPTHE
jgi:hypothetical protein